MSDIFSLDLKKNLENLDNLWKQSSANLVILGNQIRDYQMCNNNFIPPELDKKYWEYFEYNKSACTNYYKYEEYIRQEAVRQAESLRQATLIEEANKKAEQDRLSEKLNSILLSKQKQKQSKYEAYLLKYEEDLRNKLAETQHIVDCYKKDVEIIKRILNDNTESLDEEESVAGGFRFNKTRKLRRR